MSKDTKTPQNQRIQIDNYSYLQSNKIGKGFTSIVFQGKDDITEQSVSIKVIDLSKNNESNTLIQNQIAILKNLDHPNVLKMIKTIIKNNICYIVTELCKGGDLSKILNKNGRFRLSQAIPLIRQICQAYQYIHNCGIIHRDIKPANILLHQMKIKIADFGFAKYQKAEQKLKCRIGSPLYMSPQSLMSLKCTYQDDIWSLGVLIYEMLQGRTPWQVKNEQELKKKIGKNLVFRIAVQRNIEQIIRGCLNNNVKQRITIKQILNLLNGIGSSLQHSLINQSSCKTIEFVKKQQFYTQIKLLRCGIHLNRLIYKIISYYMKSINVKSMGIIYKYLCQCLGFLIQMMKNIINYAQKKDNQLKIRSQFQYSSQYSKYQAVIQEYYDKYMQYIEKKKCQPYQNQQELKPNKKIMHRIMELQLSEQKDQSYLISVDFLLSAIIVLDEFSQRKFSGWLLSMNFNQWLLMSPQILSKENLVSLKMKRTAFCKNYLKNNLHYVQKKNQ